VSLFFENFFKYNFDNLDKSQASFDLKKRFDLIFTIFEVSNINEFNKKISNIKLDSKLESNLDNLNINIQKNYEKIIGGINLLRLKNNPIKINSEEIYKIISRK
jgi:hypothetical protein